MCAFLTLNADLKADFLELDSVSLSTVTIISGIIMLILFISELQYYLTKEVCVRIFMYHHSEI